MKKIYNLLVCLCIAQFGWSQTPLYNYEFTGGLDNWVVNSLECNGQPSDEAKWMWVEDGSTEQGIYSAGYGQLDSRTPDSGIVILNSEFLDNQGLDNNFGNGDCPAPQIAELISPTMDFSGQSEVYLSFSQLYSRFRGYSNNIVDERSETATFVAVSIDGTNWEEIPVNENVTTFRVNKISENEIILDLSTWLAGAANAQVKFLWRGDYYFWAIDDVRFYGSMEDEIAISAFKYPVSNFETPKDLIKNDTMRFIADVTNLGSNTVDSAYLRVFVRANNSSRTEYFRDSILVENLMAGDTVEVTLPNYFIPNDLPAGYYVFFYNIANVEDKEELNNANNFAADIFGITEGSFKKTDRGDGVGFIFENEVIIGNYFETNHSDDVKVTLDNITFSCFAPGGASLVGENVIVKLYEIADNVAKDLSDLDRSSEQNETIKLVGIGTYEFDAADDALSPFDRFVATVVDFETLESTIELKSKGRYIAAIQYSNTSTDLIHEVGQRITFYPSLGSDQVFTVIFDENWFINAPFGNNNVAIVGMNVTADVASSNELELTEAQVKIFPNPAKDYIRVNISLDNPQDVNLFLTDVTGKILDRQEHRNFFQGDLRFDVSKYATGTYFLRVNSQEGVKVEKIIVSH